MDPVLAGLILVRTIHFVAVFAIFGTFVFWDVVVPARPRFALPRSRARSRRLLRVAAVVACASGLLWLGLTILNMAGDPAQLFDPDLLRAILLTSFGPVAVTRTILMLALIGVSLRAPPDSSLIGIISALLLVSQAWLGHAAEGGVTKLGLLMVAVYAVHALSGAAWLGSLPALAWTLTEDRGAGRSSHRRLAILLNYSSLAVVAVGTVLASGVVNTIFRSGFDITAMVRTGYGKVLGAKLACVALLVVLASVNRFVLVPRLRRGPKIQNALSASIAGELVTALLVLAAAALLGMMPPPR